MYSVLQLFLFHILLIYDLELTNTLTYIQKYYIIKKYLPRFYRSFIRYIMYVSISNRVDFKDKMKYVSSGFPLKTPIF